jgi:hypothetical protein
MVLAIILAGMHLLFSRSMIHGHHAKLLRLAAFPLFIASRWSCGLSIFVRWHGGWPAAMVESAAVGMVVVTAVELSLLFRRRSRQ